MAVDRHGVNVRPVNSGDGPPPSGGNFADSAEVLEVAASPTSASVVVSQEVLEVLAQPTSTANLDLSAEVLEVAAAPTSANFVDSAEILEVLVAWPGIAVGVCRSQLM